MENSSVGAVKSMVLDGVTYFYRMSVVNEGGAWIVYQDDLDADGKVWNTTPTFRAASFARALELSMT